MLGADQASVSVNMVEEQSDCRRRGARSSPVRDIETMPRTGQFDITDHRAGHVLETLDEASRLSHRDDVVARAVQQYERACALSCCSGY